MLKLLDWNVFSQTCTLENIETGDSVRLSPRTMDVLNYLIESQGRVVSSSELLDALWSESSSSDHAVHNAIAELRAALGDHASNPRYIKTYPKRGYSLIVSPSGVTPEIAVSASGNNGESFWRFNNHWKASFFALLAVFGIVMGSYWLQSRLEESAQNVILVLPLESLHVDSNNLFWADQLPSSLVTHLARLPNTVIVSGFGDAPTEEFVQSNFIDEVDYVLSGNVQQADNKLRLQIDLVNAKDSSIAFSDQFDISSDQVFAVHDEIGKSVVAALSIYLDESQHEEMQDWGTSNPVAYSHFLEAGFYAANSNHNDLELAIRHYNIATEEDPAFINAYVGLVRAAGSLGAYSTQQRNIELEATVNRAVRAVTRIHPAHESLLEMQNILLSIQSNNWQLIETTLRELILTGDTREYLFSRYATLLAEARLYDEAARFLELDGDEEPFRIPRRTSWLYQTFFETPDKLIQTQKRILLDRPDHIGILSALIRGFAFIGDYNDAVYYLGRQMGIDEDGPFTMLSQVTISGLWGQSTLAGDEFERSNLNNPEYNLSHGAKRFILGDIGSGIEYWRSLTPSDLRRLSVMANKIEMYFPDDVLGDERYQALLEELNLGVSWQRQLMEGVMALAPITGIELHPLSLAAYENNELLGNNNLWNHSQITYPNRSAGSSLSQPGNPE